MRNKEHYCQECLSYSKEELTQQGWLCDECNEGIQIQMKKAMEDAIALENEIYNHNMKIINSLTDNIDDYEIGLLDDGCVDVTGKIEWVEEPKHIKSQQNAEKYGVFTLKYVDQWSTGWEGDSFSGYMYVGVENHKKYLKIPYSC
jgi:hypothetical protein